jgi:hypothetical protein
VGGQRIFPSTAKVKHCLREICWLSTIIVLHSILQLTLRKENKAAVLHHNNIIKLCPLLGFIIHLHPRTPQVYTHARARGGAQTQRS